MRILILMLALLLCIPTAVAEEGDFIPNSRNLPAELIEIPEAYFQPCDTPGTMVRLDYDTWESFSYESKTYPLRKTAWVYLPYGYSEDVQYNIMYFMHGGWSNETTQMGTDERPSYMKHVVDHAIADGLMQPDDHRMPHLQQYFARGQRRLRPCPAADRSVSQRAAVRPDACCRKQILNLCRGFRIRRTTSHEAI